MNRSYQGRAQNRFAMIREREIVKIIWSNEDLTDGADIKIHDEQNYTILQIQLCGN